MDESAHRLRGLYAITDASLQRPGQLAERVTAAVVGGARLIQYRDKSGDERLRLAQACALAGVCREHGVVLIINDDVQLAAAAGAHGVHLGRADADATAARQQLGTDAVIGVSCYNDWERAEQAAGLGADYIAFGSLFPSATKPAAVRADLELIRRAKRDLRLPVAAIGGITADNAGPVIAAGADMLAVVRAVFGAADVRKAAAAFAGLFEPPDPSDL